MNLHLLSFSLQLRISSGPRKSWRRGATCFTLCTRQWNKHKHKYEDQVAVVAGLFRTGVTCQLTWMSRRSFSPCSTPDTEVREGVDIREVVEVCEEREFEVVKGRGRMVNWRTVAAAVRHPRLSVL